MRELRSARVLGIHGRSPACPFRQPGQGMPRHSRHLRHEPTSRARGASCAAGRRPLTGQAERKLSVPRIHGDPGGIDELDRASSQAGINSMICSTAMQAPASRDDRAPSMPGSTPIQVFVAYDFEIPGNLQDWLTSVKEAPPDGFKVCWPGELTGKSQGEIWSDIVQRDIEKCERLLAFLDLPNANVGYEIGYALGKGKRVALACIGKEFPPHWAKVPPLNGYMCPRLESVPAICKTIAADNNKWVHIGKKVQAGTDVLVLCPEVGGEPYLKQINTCGWRMSPGTRWNLRELPEQLAGVGFVLWVIAPHNDGPKSRDGNENAALSVIAGYAAAHPEITLRVLAHQKARPVADILGHRINFDIESFKDLATRSVQDWCKGRAPRPVSVPPPAAMPSAIDAARKDDQLHPALGLKAGASSEFDLRPFEDLAVGSVHAWRKERAWAPPRVPPPAQMPSAKDDRLRGPASDLASEDLATRAVASAPPSALTPSTMAAPEDKPSNHATGGVGWGRLAMRAAGLRKIYYASLLLSIPFVLLYIPLLVRGLIVPPKASKQAIEVMAQVPAGTFMMGSTDGRDDERPVHEVTLSPYEIDKTQVSVAQYRECVEHGKCEPARPCPFRPSFPGYLLPEKEDYYPITCVTWAQADAYCRWQGKELPTEAQWEFAARGTERRKYPWGDEVTIDKICSPRPWLCPTASYPAGASPFGVLNMVGNGFEWTADWHGSYPNRPEKDPRGAREGTARVVRGGGLWGYDFSLRGTLRGKLDPGEPGFLTSFRCVRVVTLQ